VPASMPVVSWTMNLSNMIGLCMVSSLVTVLWLLLYSSGIEIGKNG
jgi:hypothetical protein